jgi:UDP-N-acetylmuramyl pentapeptide phosphotransferase/UDP-N-acetylglucosamine-1-phosphate transferase
LESDRVSATDRLGLTVPQAVVAWSLAFLIGGAAGLIAMLACHYLLSFGGEDSAQKHGISQVKATRIGGVAIVVYLLLHLWFQMGLGHNTLSFEVMVLFAASIVVFMIGVFEDLYAGLSAKLRFVLMLLIGAGAVVTAPGLVLQPVGIPGLDTLLKSTMPLAMLFTGLCVAFIPNAFNTADGANGLVSGISACVFAALATQAPQTIAPLLSSAFVGCLLFLVFNLISGRFFLGDGGAYFLGALSGLSVIVVSNATDVSVWWLLALIFYPAADLIWSMARRVWAGKSPLEPDNQHLHNLLFALLDSGPRTSMQANTLTGLAIAFVFSGLPAVLVVVLGLSAASPAWFFGVCLQWALYVIAYQLLTRRVCVLETTSTAV